MTVRLCTIAILTPVILSSMQPDAQARTQSHSAPYLGQKMPGSTPVVFAPDLVSTKHRETNPFFSPDMTEFYFTKKDLNSEAWDLISYVYKDKQWHHSVVGPRIGRPLLAPDGETMYLGKYYMTRTDCGWSQLKRIGPMFDRHDWGIMRLSASSSKTYVLDDYKSGDIIRISELKNGERLPPIALGPQINTGKYNAHPFIAPDDSYIIWDGVRQTGFGDSDLYISFKQVDGTWSEAVNMGASINTSAREASASVTPDGKFLFFTRETPNNDHDIYWVDARIIETLKTKISL
ncbi:hypothetical protein L1286_12140 [Pseudoalteromonas sp. SMS1]|uniref:hypothetical protein n=1 Tax=Pseudoalteromonas sp. SMS1 TaxID=2908894 RepID=UPI001F42C57B|nr:hypothetical protein [Pseudoalteromonas sp. SMS1]MCF2858227.1 hypothetical protein [Pseudoalteromonas sp. SMS1]